MVIGPIQLRHREFSDHSSQQIFRNLKQRLLYLGNNSTQKMKSHFDMKEIFLLFRMISKQLHQRDNLADVELSMQRILE